MSARDEILARLRKATGGRTAGERLEAPPRGPRPGRADGDAVARFVREAEASGATVGRVARPDDVPEALSAWLAGENLPAELVASPDPALDRYPWEARPLLSLERRAAGDGDRVSLTPVFRGVAETGTLALLSGAGRPATLNFLPEVHVALLSSRDIVGAYEDMWEAVRASGAMPRTVNLVTGPSRSADIGQKLQMGAHGPKRVHILLVDDEEPRQR